MEYINKVIWSEGLFVTPQHFQQQERYFTQQSQIHNAANSCYHWGVIQLDIDEGLLADSKFAIRHCQVILPDGTIVSTPQSIKHQDLELPQPKAIPPNTSKEIIYLGLPLTKNTIAEVSDNHNAETMTRYINDETELLDLSCTNSEKEKVDIGRLNCRLLLASEDRSAYSYVAIAKIDHLENNKIFLNAGFIPPTLNCHAVTVLNTYIKEAYSLIHTQAQAVLKYVRDDEYGSNFFLSQLLRRYDAVMCHFVDTPSISPESFYIVLIQIINEISVFQRDIKCNLKPYRHDNLQETFPPLMDLLRNYLKSSVDKDVFRIPLDNAEIGLFSTPITRRLKEKDINLKDLFVTASFYLAVKSKEGPDAVKEKFSEQVKIGASQRIRQMVASLVSGVKIKHCPHIPPKLPYDETFIYFELEQTGEFWASLKDANGIAIYADDPFQDVKLMLWAIRNK